MTPAPAELDVDGRTIELSNLDRVLWPATGFTKGDMVDYYRRVAPVLVPHLAGHPVTLARLPEGIDGPGWYQTNCRGHPPWMRTHEVRGKGGDVLRYCVIDDAASLLWAANQGTIELHPLPWAVDRPDRAPAIMFDLDPGAPTGLAEAARVALGLREALADAGLESFVKTSGSKGMHVLVPLNGDATFEATKRFARQVAEDLARSDPDRVTARTGLPERRGKVLVDWLQNDPGRSIAAAYSLRAASVPRVSTPVRWDELHQRPDPRFSPREALRRVEELGDLLAPVLSLRQQLP